MYTKIIRAFSTTYTKSKQINLPANTFYNTVVNVSDYKNFVPLTEDSEIITK